METDLRADLTTMRDKLAREMESDAKQMDELAKRMEKSKALFQHIRGLLATYETGSGNAESKSSVRSLVKELVNSMEKPFTTTDAMIAWKRFYPDREIKQHRISSTLWKLADEGEIRVLSKGTGGRDVPTYERLNGAVKGTKEGIAAK